MGAYFECRVNTKCVGFRERKEQSRAMVFGLSNYTGKEGWHLLRRDSVQVWEAGGIKDWFFSVLSFSCLFGIPTDILR